MKACCVLHNICITNNIDLPVPEEGEAMDYEIVNIDQREILENVNADLLAARHMQQRIINNHFI